MGRTGDESDDLLRHCHFPFRSLITDAFGRSTLLNVE
jgi:hypothetical protein